jgi:hypothetical protein
MTNNACRNCERRTVGCHSTCKEYAEFRARVAAEKQNRKWDQADLYKYQKVVERRKQK